MNVLDGLTGSQRQAVTTTDGPVLIVAGPGTGKTLTIVRRIAYLVQQGARPESILAVTFTNRAAREMRERAEALLGDAASRVFIGTLHLLGLRMIRHAMPEGVTVCSREEQIALLQGPANKSPAGARELAERISRVKSLGEGPDEVLARVYEEYHAALKRNHAVDFDDLILIPIELLSAGDAPVLFRDSPQYIMVDEYQDINPAQYRLLRLLAQDSGNLCAIGDSDQAIYGFRGADAGAFLSFGTDFTDAATITLRESFRSSGVILTGAGSLIRHNRKRREKEIVPTREQGSAISVVSVPDERLEGAFIVREIEARIGGTSHERLMRGGSRSDAADRSFSFSDFAVIYRTNAQAKALEEAFSASGIPYQVIGRRSGAQMKEREEARVYLRSFMHPDDTDGADLADADEAKLLAPADFFDPRADAVVLMTLHMAKGLEFKVVFIAGCDDGLIPYTRGKDVVDIEEERRLLYVGMTRAKDELFLLHARNRFLYGQRLSPLPSPFLGEIPGGLTQAGVVPERRKKEQKQEEQLGLF